MSRRDIVTWMLQCVAQHAPEISPETLRTIEAKARREWGGQRIDYVAKTVGRDGPGRRLSDPEKAAILADALSGTPTDEILSRHGCSRATLYRLVKLPGGTSGFGET